MDVATGTYFIVSVGLSRYWGTSFSNLILKILWLFCHDLYSAAS